MDVFLIEDGGLLKKYNTLWVKVCTDINKELDNESVYNKKFLKTKIKSYSGEATYFHDKEICKAGLIFTCLTVIAIDSALKKR